MKGGIGMKMKTLLQKQFRFSTVCWIVLAVSFFWVCFYAEPDDLPFSERGTYDYKETESEGVFIWMSVDWLNGEFYYTDQINQYRIYGKVEECGANRYWFRCASEKSKAVIPDQLMTRHDNDEITLMIGDEVRRFIKSGTALIIVGLDDYE